MARQYDGKTPAQLKTMLSEARTGLAETRKLPNSAQRTTSIGTYSKIIRDLSTELRHRRQSGQ